MFLQWQVPEQTAAPGATFSFAFFFSPLSVYFSDNGSGSGEGGEYQAPVMLAFGLSF